MRTRSKARLRGAVIGLLALVTGLPALAGEVVRQSLQSTVLQRELPYLVYLPDGYGTGPAQRYPVLYLLHGAHADESAWFDRGGIKERVDALIASGSIPPTILVMPGCRGSWWVDGAKDKAETAFWTELVPTIDQIYPTIAKKQGRLIAGVSAGGYGAVRFAMKYPDKIAAIAAFSPAVFAVTPPAPSAARFEPAFLRPDGTFNQSMWDALNYPRLASGYLNQDQRVGFYLMAGESDRLGIAYETERLYKALADKQPGMIAYHTVPGGHDWDTWTGSIDEAFKYVFSFVPRTHASLEDEPTVLEASRPDLVQ